jgi:hypothetical protein|tara:strand:- start:101 stop:295 length:195 start_codon:yes stop_codon:yes gene_type:complete
LGALCEDENDDQKKHHHHSHVRVVVVVVVVVVPNYTPWTMMVVCNAPRRAFAVKKHADDDLMFC